MAEPRYRWGDPAPVAVASRRANDLERQHVRYRNRVVTDAESERKKLMAVSSGFLLENKAPAATRKSRRPAKPRGKGDSA